MFGVVLIFRDITHIQKMEEEAQKMAKLESVGTLAGGIAHDFITSSPAYWAISALP
jgi:hypothetical protein